MISLALIWIKSNALGWLKSHALYIFAVCCGALLLVGIYNNGYIAGAGNVQAAWDKSIADAKDGIIAKEKDRVIFNTAIGGKREIGIKAIDDILGTVIDSLQQPASSNLLGKSNPARQPNGCAADNEFYAKRREATARIERKLLELYRQCDIQTSDFILLREWQKGTP